ncbi:MAG: family 43 glycosylhydrolase [Oscillospiraceae bacterium]|nr:family 43 glycosylhydrolase [Oscillospiraceae bacterium]
MKKEAFNPYLPLSVYIPDGEPHVFGDRVYVFGSHDKENGDTFCALDYEFWSAPADDLSDWSSKGINYRASQDPLYSEKMKYMYAPDCVCGSDDRYYLYYCLSGCKGQGGYSNPISVAVCDTPDGKYEYYGYVRNPDGTPLMRYACFDPAVINDGGTVRLYYGTTMPWMEHIRPRWLKNRLLAKGLDRTPEEVSLGVLGSYHVTLAEDMLTVTSAPKRIDNTISGEEYKNHAFFEGSSIRKIGERYYFIYSSANNHELCYAASLMPDGGFVYGGTIISNGDIGYKGRAPKDRVNHTGTNHGSIEKIGDDYYVFHHRLTHNSDYSRQGCAERIEILPDGSIPQVEITSCGLNGEPLKGGAYPAGICCGLTNGRMTHGSNSNKKLREPCFTSSGDERYITGITDGTQIIYKYFSLGGRCRLALTTRGGDGAFETNLGITLPVKAYPGWTKSVSEFTLKEGVYPLILTYRGRGEAELKEFELRCIDK